VLSSKNVTNLECALCFSLSVDCISLSLSNFDLILVESDILSALNSFFLFRESIICDFLAISFSFLVIEDFFSVSNFLLFSFMSSIYFSFSSIFSDDRAILYSTSLKSSSIVFSFCLRSIFIKEKI